MKLLPLYPLLTALIPTLALAQIPIATTPEVITFSERFIRESGSTSLITREEIMRSNARTVGDLLRRTSGVDFSEQAGVSYASIRGGSNSHTLVYVDGVRMNDPSAPGRTFDFSNLDLNQVESIEIQKGSQSVQYGSDALAGVILIRTRDGLGLRQLTIREEVGSRLSNRASLMGSASVGRDWRIQASLSQDSSRGFSTADALSGDQDGHQKYGGTLSLMGEVTPDWSVDLRSGVDLARSELDFGPSQDDPNYLYRVRALRNSLLLKHEITPRQTLHLDFSHLAQRRQAINAPDSLQGASLDDLYRGQVSAAGVNLQQTQDWGELSLGLNFQRESYQQTSSSAPPTQGHALLGGTHAQFRSLWIQDLRWKGGLRRDEYESVGGQTIYQAGLEHRIGTKGVSHLSFGTGYKAPSLTERLDPTYGEPGLRSERSRSLELGQSWTLSKSTSLNWNLFRTRYQDLIGYDFNTNRVTNTDEALIRGGELSLDLSAYRWKFRPHVTYLRSEDLQRREELPRRARWKGGLFTDLAWSESTHLEIELLATTSRLNQSGATLRAPGRWIAHLSARHQLRRNLLILGRVENLLNQDAPEAVGYTQKPLGIFAALEWNL